MPSALKNVLTNMVSPLLRRPKRVQVAAICYSGEGPERKVLLITSRDTRRWVVPKGWPIDGLDAAGAALQEAWEEAGVRKANISAQPVGTYDYDKLLEGGAPVAVETTVFALEVEQMESDFPEASERTLKWVAPSVAADMVDEPGLKDILRQI